MTQFTFPTNLADHLENEIYNKLIASVQIDVDRYNAMWAEREQKGETYHTETYIRRGKEYSDKIYWYKLTKGLLDVTFFQEDSYGQMANDYYRPWYCKVDLEACFKNAREQRNHSVALLESRINSHVATTDILHELQDTLNLGKGNLIEGYVDGTTANGERFRIHTQMMWNYRYGENSANGYMTQYVQFRSDRRGARQEGKSVQQAITDAEPWKLTSDTGEIIPESTTVANTWEVFDTEISADKKGLFLKLTVSAGAVDVFCKYHYET